MANNSASLDTRTGDITGVVRLLTDLTDKQLEDFSIFCSGFMGDYYYIIHDKDVDENGEPLPRHLHFVFKLGNTTRKRLSTWLNLIADTLGLDTCNGIEIKPTTSFVGSVQYLTHQNHPNKHQYSKDLIQTNVNRDTLDTILHMARNGLDIDYLIYVIEHSLTIIDVMRTLGLHYYHVYRPTINDIWKHYKGN